MLGDALCQQNTRRIKTPGKEELKQLIKTEQEYNQWVQQIKDLGRKVISPKAGTSKKTKPLKLMKTMEMRISEMEDEKTPAHNSAEEARGFSMTPKLCTMPNLERLLNPSTNPKFVGKRAYSTVEQNLSLINVNPKLDARRSTLD